MIKKKKKIAMIVICLVLTITGLIFLQFNISKKKQNGNAGALIVDMYGNHKKHQAEKSDLEKEKTGAEVSNENTPKKSSSGGSGSSISKSDSSSKPKPNTYYPPYIVANSASGKSTSSTDSAILDYSNANSGYVMLRYSGSNPKVKTLIQNSSSGFRRHQFITRNYGSYEAFPLSQGSGNYSVVVYENVSGNTYTPIISKNISTSISATAAFIRPNQIVNYYSGTNAVKYAAELTRGTTNNTQKINAIYNYIIKNVKYDHNKAANVANGYIPSVGSTFSSKRGICFDYATLMAAMCRSQKIPCRVVAGNTPQGLHAWVEVYNGGWKRMDPTFASEGTSTSYINNSSNYRAQFYY